MKGRTTFCTPTGVATANPEQQQFRDSDEACGASASKFEMGFTGVVESSVRESARACTGELFATTSLLLRESVGARSESKHNRLLESIGQKYV
jgi:hypothetical protein